MHPPTQLLYGNGIGWSILNTWLDNQSLLKLNEGRKNHIYQHKGIISIRKGFSCLLWPGFEPGRFKKPLWWLNIRLKIRLSFAESSKYKFEHPIIHTHTHTPTPIRQQHQLNLCYQHHGSTVTSSLWRLKAAANRVLVPQLVQINGHINIKFLRSPRIQ